MADDRPPSSSDMIRQAREQLTKPPSRSTRPAVDEASIEIEVEQELRPSNTPAARPERQRLPVPDRSPNPSPFPIETRRTRREARTNNPVVPLVVVGMLVILGLALLLSLASTTITP